jgi:diacylglycerol kinase family enzyme
MFRTIEVIINTRSGSAARESNLDERLRSIFESAGCRLYIQHARSGKEVLDLARVAVDGPADTIVAGGGDGTVSTVASTLVGTAKRLGVLPLGTLNHFAKGLHIPLELEEATRTIIEGREKKVDVGDVNGRIFINNSSIGLYPQIVKQRQSVQRLGHGKWPSLLWAVVSVMRRFPTLNVRVEVDGEELAHKVPFVFVGNNEYKMEGFRIGERELLDQGKLSVYLTHSTGRFGLLRLGILALLGRLQNAKEFYATLTEELWVETRRKHISVAIDGELNLMKTPLHYRTHPGALRVMVPADPQQDGENR